MQVDFQRMKDFLSSDNMKTVVCVLAVELALQLFVTYKGYGDCYLPVTLLLMLFTIASCAVTFLFQADRYLLIVVVLLLDLGFMVQGIENGVHVRDFVVKFTAAMLTAFAAAFLYRLLAAFLADERVLWGLMALQLLICVVMTLFAEVVGSGSGQEAAISIAGVTPFEFVKVIYLFVAAGLICKKEKKDVRIRKLRIPREIVLILHTLLLSGFFLICKELGTMLIVWITGLVIGMIFGQRRELFTTLSVLSAVVFLAVWTICDKTLYPLLQEGRLSLPGVTEKLISRFGTALHPELYLAGDGYQGTLALESLAIGSVFGIGSERYRLNLPMAANDFVFANLVQTCGLVLGLIVLLLFFVLIKRGSDISAECTDPYFQGLGCGVVILIAVEVLVHVGYNIGLLPITGIPLYLVSQGFSAILTGMTLIAILLAMSTGLLEREV